MRCIALQPRHERGELEKFLGIQAVKQGVVDGRLDGHQLVQELHALWETGFAALGNSDPKNKNSLRDAIAGLDIQTIVGPVKFKGSPIKNVTVTSLSGGQWRKTKGGKSKFELLIVHNGTAPFIPKQADLVTLSKLA